MDPVVGGLATRPDVERQSGVGSIALIAIFSGSLRSKPSKIHIVRFQF
jgi:hypothetical protein